MDNEDFILKKAGRKNPFTTPEGYFDDLTRRTMENIAPAEQRVYNFGSSKTKWIRTVLYSAAACIAAAVLITTAIPDGNTDKMNVTGEETAKLQTDDAYVEAVTDYLMMDNADIYAYLTEE